MNIVIVGHVCIDKNTSENSVYQAAGSPAMFMHTIFSQLPECNVTIISPYGEDFSEYIEDSNTYPKKPSEKVTLVYENVTKNGKRNQKAYNRNAELVEITNEVTEILQKADLVIIAPILPNFTANYIENIVSSLRKNVPVFLLPQGYYRNFDTDDNVIQREFIEDKDVLLHCNFVIVSKEDYRDMINVSKKWARDYHLTSIVTLGGEGAVSYTGTEEIKLPTEFVLENQVVDSVGCGDIFAAAFSYRYAQTNDIEEAGRFANILARQSLFYKADEIKIDYKKALLL